jgi:hypothetical protein
LIEVAMETSLKILLILYLIYLIWISSSTHTGKIQRGHDRALRELAGMVEKERTRKMTVVIQRPYSLSKKGTAKTKRSKPSLLDTDCTDWEPRVDLDRKHVFPDVVETTLRQDIIILSKQSETLIATWS